jgi:hypothetical protein
MGETAAGHQRNRQPSSAGYEQPETAEGRAASRGSASSSTARGHTDSASQWEEDTRRKKEVTLAVCGEEGQKSSKSFKIPQWEGVVSITAAHLELRGIKHDPGAHRNQSTTEARRRRRRRRKTPC